MSYHVYTTKGIVLSLRPVKEVDKLAIILTKDLGLVHASVRGVRRSGSKVVNMLGELALVKVSLIKGKRSWRVTTVTLIESPSTLLKNEREKLKALYRVSDFLSKLMRGEEKQTEVFDALEEALLALSKGEVSEDDLEAWELQVVSKLLSHLGYLSENSVPKDLSDIKRRKKEIVLLINEGIHVSGLR